MSTDNKNVAIVPSPVVYIQDIDKLQLPLSQKNPKLSLILLTNRFLCNEWHLKYDGSNTDQCLRAVSLLRMYTSLRHQLGICQHVDMWCCILKQIHHYCDKICYILTVN